MEKISVIIPVYNGEKTIGRCLESITASKYENYEIILIDDGSTDKSASILSEYVEKDSRIKLMIHPHSGPSEARNKGLEVSKEGIIAFVDCDDYVRGDYLDQLAKAFGEESVDVVFFEYYRVTPEGTRLSCHKLPEMESEYVKNLASLSEADMFGYSWIKAFRKKAAHPISFDPDMNLMEDEVFACELLEQPVSLFYLREPIYFYCIGNSLGNLMQRTYPDYCRLCDKVYHAWHRMLGGTPDGRPFLEGKANRLAQSCKYYGLERKVNPFLFYREMEAADFMGCCTSSDPFIIALKKKKRCRAAWLYLKDKMLHFIRKGKG